MERLEVLKEYLKSDPDDSFLNYALALEYAKKLEFDKALSILQNVIAKDENYLGAYYQLGKLYEQSNNSGEAIAIYKKGIQIAERLKNSKTLGELKEALMMLEDED